jgi:hypothetical protein
MPELSARVLWFLAAATPPPSMATPVAAMEVSSPSVPRGPVFGPVRRSLETIRSSRALAGLTPAQPSQSPVKGLAKVVLVIVTVVVIVVVYLHGGPQSFR